MDQLTFIDWFAGIGGFRRGLEEAGFKCVGFCENDKYATASYTSMHLITPKQREYLATLDMRKRQKEILKEEYRNGEWYARDIRAVNVSDIPRADLWAFGFPCQDISLSGCQLGFKGSRSSLFFRVMYLVGQTAEEERPTYLLIENVRNLLSVNGGWDFARLLIELDKNGYDAEWQVLNSKDFGVPQNRERVFIIGHLRGRSRCKVFPIERAIKQNSAEITQINTALVHPSVDSIYLADGLSPTILARDYKDAKRIAQPLKHTKEDVTESFCKDVNQNAKHQQDLIQSPYGTSRCIPAGTHASTPHLLKTAFVLKDQKSHPINTEDDGTCKTIKASAGRITAENYTTHSGSYAQTGVAVEMPSVIGGIGEMKSNSGTQWYQQDRVYDSEGVATSLSASLPGGANMYGINVKDCSDVQVLWYEKKQTYVAIRRLTPKECFRLQGWDDIFFERAEFVNSDTQLYKQAGNGVTVNVIRTIGTCLNPL